MVGPWTQGGFKALVVGPWTQRGSKSRTFQEGSVIATQRCFRTLTKTTSLARAFKDRGVGGRSMEPGWVQGLGGRSMDPAWVQKSILPAMLSNCNAMVLQYTHKNHLIRAFKDRGVGGRSMDPARVQPTIHGNYLLNKPLKQIKYTKNARVHTTYA